MILRIENLCRFLPITKFGQLLFLTGIASLFFNPLGAEEFFPASRQVLPLSSPLLPAQKKSTKNPKKLFSYLAPKGRYAVVTASLLNLRSGPDTEHQALRMLPEGTHLRAVASLRKDWLKVRVPQGKEGWVARKHIRLYRPKPLPVGIGKLSAERFTSPLEAAILYYMKDVYDKKRLSREDRLSIVVQDLATGGLAVSIRPRRRVKSASTIKVAILHAYMLQRYRGKIRHTAKAQKYLTEMIRYSSNSGTNAILKLLGGPAKIQHILNQTRMYRELSLVEYIPAGGRTYRNKISAADLNQIFVRLWFRRGIGSGFGSQKNRRASKEMLNLLGLPGHPWMPDRIKGGTCFASNQTVKIWDKTGFVKGVNGNAGIVEIDTPHGRKAYSITLFIERPNYRSISGDANSWSARASLQMRKISEMTYAYFSGRYDSYNRCGRSRLIRYAGRALTTRPLVASNN